MMVFGGGGPCAGTTGDAMHTLLHRDVCSALTRGHWQSERLTQSFGHLRSRFALLVGARPVTISQHYRRAQTPNRKPKLPVPVSRCVGPGPGLPVSVDRRPGRVTCSAIHLHSKCSNDGLNFLRPPQHAAGRGGTVLAHDSDSSEGMMIWQAARAQIYHWQWHIRRLPSSGYLQVAGSGLPHYAAIG